MTVITATSRVTRRSLMKKSKHDLMTMLLDCMDREEKSVSSLRTRINNRLDAHLCEMQEGYDDSIVGFNTAWDIVRSVFDEETMP